MTKKHFVAIASILKENRTMIDKMTLKEINLLNATIDCISYDMVEIFERYNPLFDGDKFLKACGVEN